MAQAAGLMRIGFFTGNAISLMQECDLHPILKVSSFLEVFRYRCLTNGMYVSSAEETVGSQAILHLCRHMYEVITRCVVATVDDLQGNPPTVSSFLHAADNSNGRTL
jgi:hypothetical protein